MAITAGTLRNEFNNAVDENILCRNMLLITLSAMRESDRFTKADEEKIVDYLMERGYSDTYIDDMMELIIKDIRPTDAQIKSVLKIMNENHQYIEGYVRDRLMKDVDKNELRREDGRALKQYIYDTEQVELILDAIGCGHIRQNPSETYWHCSNIDGDNPKSIVVKNQPYLGVSNHTRIDDFDNNRGDLIALVEYNLKCDYKKAMKFIKSILNGDEEAANHLIIKAGNNGIYERKVKKEELKEERVFPEKIISYFEPVLHKSWKEEITEEAREKYSVCYFHDKRQILIPLRRWYDGALLGFNRRNSRLAIEVLGYSKYMFTRGFNRSQNVYGYFENKTDIEKSGYVTVHESEKSVMKRFSNGDSTGVATFGKGITTKQVKIINTLNVEEVVIAYDSDVDIDEIRWICEQFYGDKKVSYIWDSWGLLGEKQAPADLCNKDYMKLFDNRIVYDGEERQLYLESLKKR